MKCLGEIKELYSNEKTVSKELADIFDEENEDDFDHLARKK